jgi:hypothetical protein
MAHDDNFRPSLAAAEDPGAGCACKMRGALTPSAGQCLSDRTHRQSRDSARRSISPPIGEERTARLVPSGAGGGSRPARWPTPCERGGHDHSYGDRRVVVAVLAVWGGGGPPPPPNRKWKPPRIKGID